MISSPRLTFACISTALSLFMLAENTQGQGISSMLPGPGTAHSSGGGGYTGPGDLQSVAIFYGLRALSAAKRGSNAIQACDSGDAHCVNIPTDATTGDLAVSTTTVGSGACNNTTNVCTIKVWYNQGSAASADTDGATVSTSRCVLTINGSGGGTKVSGVCPGNATFYQTGGSVTQAQPISILATAKAKTTSQQFNPIIESNCAAVHFFYSNSNQLDFYAGTASALKGTIDTSWHGVGAAFSNSTSDAYAIDATTGTAGSATGTNGLSNSLTLMGDNACAGQYGNVNFEEAMVVYSALSQANIAAINSNSKTYWGY